MSDRWQTRLTALVLILNLAAAARAAGPETEARRRGLVAVYRDDARPQPTEIVRLEPILALALSAGEAPHPRLQAKGTASWKGQVNLLRPGKYRFSVRLR